MLNTVLHWHWGKECGHGTHAEIGEGRVPLHTACGGIQEFKVIYPRHPQTYPVVEARESHVWVARRIGYPCSGLCGQPVEALREVADFA